MREGKKSEDEKRMQDHLRCEEPEKEKEKEKQSQRPRIMLPEDSRAVDPDPSDQNDCLAKSFPCLSSFIARMPKQQEVGNQNP